jgi:hypothetical protein
MAFTEQDEQAARSQLAACALLIFQARRVVELEEHTKAAAAAARAEHKPNFRAAALGSPSERIPQPPPVNIPASRPPPLPRSHPQLSEATTAAAAPAGKAPAAGPPRAAQQELSNSSLLDAFFVITQELSGAHNLRVLLGSALRSCKRLVPVQSASCFLTGEDDGSMLRVALVQDEHGKDVAGELSVVRIRDVRSGLDGGTDGRPGSGPRLGPRLGLGGPGGRGRYLALVCGTPLDASSFPDLDPKRVQSGGGGLLRAY